MDGYRCNSFDSNGCKFKDAGCGGQFCVIGSYNNSQRGLGVVVEFVSPILGPEYRNFCASDLTCYIRNIDLVEVTDESEISRIKEILNFRALSSTQACEFPKTCPPPELG